MSKAKPQPPARTKGDLKIIRADGTIEFVDKRQADLNARRVCRRIDVARERELMFSDGEDDDG